MKTCIKAPTLLEWSRLIQSNHILCLDYYPLTILSKSLVFLKVFSVEPSKIFTLYLKMPLVSFYFTFLYNCWWFTPIILKFDLKVEKYVRRIIVEFQPDLSVGLRLIPVSEKLVSRCFYTKKWKFIVPSLHGSY
jgi:hypothetical protein